MTNWVEIKLVYTVKTRTQCDYYEECTSQHRDQWHIDYITVFMNWLKNRVILRIQLG